MLGETRFLGLHSIELVVITLGLVRGAVSTTDIDRPYIRNGSINEQMEMLALGRDHLMQ